jgi:hypothetical protein
MRKRLERRVWQDVLHFTAAPQSRTTVRRHYKRYRAESPEPLRCENDSCRFYEANLIWNGKPLPLVLDHVNGVSRDNRPQNLRFLCPNCDSQLPTRGGRNKGRVRVSAGGYAIKTTDGRRDYTLVAERGEYHLRGGRAQLSRGQGEEERRVSRKSAPRA